jgi:hypothetical protein
VTALALRLCTATNAGGSLFNIDIGTGVEHGDLTVLIADAAQCQFDTLGDRVPVQIRPRVGEAASTRWRETDMPHIRKKGPRRWQVR